MNKPRVAVYRSEYPLISEAFITEQVRFYQHYAPVIISRKRKAQAALPHISIREDIGMLEERIFSFTGRSRGLEERLQGKIDLIHSHFGPGGTYMLGVAGRLDVPLVCTFHGVDCTQNDREKFFSKGIAGKRYLALRSRLSSRADAVIAVSKFIKTRLIEQGFSPDKIFTHYIGVDTERFSPSLKRDQRSPYILSVGRHTEKKGIDDLINAFSLIHKAFPNFKLIQIGAGEETAILKKLISDLSLQDKVHLLGGMDHAQVLEYMKGAEVFALPSRTAKDGDSEALGIVFNEASACAVPVLSTRHGGIPEAVIDGRTGLLAEERDVAGLAERLALLLGNEELRQSMGTEGRNYVLENFDVRLQSPKLEGIYDALIKR